MPASHRIFATTIADLLLSTADQYADNDLLIFPERRLTYREFPAASYRRARSLRASGVHAGDHVGILMANCPQYMELMMGCLLLGAVAVPMNARYQPPELAYVVENADLKLLVTSDLIADHADFGALLGAAFPALSAQ